MSLLYRSEDWEKASLGSVLSPCQAALFAADPPRPPALGLDVTSSVRVP